MANDLLDNLNRLLASLVCGRLVLDPQGMVLQSDVAAGQILGQGEAGLKGRGFDSLFTAWDQSPGVFSSLDKSGVTAIPLAAIRADGSNLAISMTISPSPEEMPPGYTCLFTDLDTFMRHMAMEEGHQINYRHIFEQHPLPCLMLDGELRISDVNRAFAGLFKESLADLDPPVRKGQQPLSVPALKRLLNLAEPAGEPATPGKPALEDCLENHAAGQWEVPKSGTGPEAYTLSLLALKDLAGMHSGFLISRLPGSEPARQGGMQQGGYHEYLGRLGHELRTPLNAVLGYLRLAEECEGPPGLESLNHVRNARIAARNLLELINNLLELARLESGRVNLQTGELDIRELAEEVTHAMAAMAFSRNLEIGCHVHPDIPLKINAAPMALRQILYNLLSNGIKYTDQGGVWLRISQPEGAAPGLKIEVGDTGRGIDPADQEKIFESFVRASRQEDDDAGSAGLGLAIIRHLVDLLQGKIELESRPGQGSLFSVILPAEQQGRQPQPPPQPPPQPRNLFNGRRALLIAPERNTRALFAARLTELGLETTQKDSPEGALEVLAEAQAQGSQVDVLFMDHRCGRTAACALAASIRACPDFDPPGLIFLSPLGDIKEFDELTRNGFNGFLTKPAAFRQVEMALLQLFKGGPSPRDEYPAGVERKTLLFTPPPMKKDGSRPQVLVVDDNPVNRKLLNAILGKVGYQVWLAENGKQAVEEVSRQRFDAVLMDVQMPEMDGLEATRKIRDRLGGRPLPIIAMTAKTMDQDRERCLQAGMNEYLPKPVIPEVLLRLLASWITDPEGGRRQGGMGAIITNYNVLPVLDQRHFRQLREYAATQDGDFYPELLAFFQGEVRGFLKTLEELRENGGEDRLAALTRWAGSLASVCSGLGSPRLHRLARELESQLSEDMTLPTTQVLHRITGEGNALLVQLERESAGWETRNG